MYKVIKCFKRWCDDLRDPELYNKQALIIIIVMTFDWQ